MSRQDRIDGVIASLHEAVLGDVHWPATAKLIDEAFATRGTHLIVVGSPPLTDAGAPRVAVRPALLRRRTSPDLAKLYVEHYFAQDETQYRFDRLLDPCATGA